jgi:predicted DNA binding protein
MSTTKHQTRSGIVAEYEITSEKLPLTDVAAVVPNATIEVEVQFVHESSPIIIAQVSSAPTQAVEDALDGSDTVGQYTRIGQRGETLHYKITLRDEPGSDREDTAISAFHQLASSNVVIEETRVRPTGWVQLSHFCDRGALSEFSSFWVERCEFSLRRITHSSNLENPQDGMSGCQQEAIQTAYEMGYFDVPRTASQEDIADELGITASSLSERLRRAESKIVKNIFLK